jgi:hypothetical protein
MGQMLRDRGRKREAVTIDQTGQLREGPYNMRKSGRFAILASHFSLEA